jgi:hypothetical protein
MPLFSHFLRPQNSKVKNSSHKKTFFGDSATREHGLVNDPAL